MAIKAFYCVGTHWDREWYEPFQEFRMWLVELIDELMDLMARDLGYVCFHLDGQAVVLEDYLEIRPERREDLIRLLKEGRLIAGPWYVLPDEWLISGESFVRNVMMGMKTCRDLGVEPMPFAYTPDQFGHIAALPMIMTGFDLKAGICWRGAQDENFPAQFIWIGPDGSRMVTHKLMDRGSYGPFDFLARTPIKREGWTDESFRKHFEPYFSDEIERARMPLVLLLDAIDHQRPDPEMPKLFEELKRRYPDTEFTWGSLAEYGEEMVRRAPACPEYEGELREPCRASDRVGQYLIVHTISSRYPIKERNDRCQALLERWAEPAALFQQLDHGAPIVRYLDTAWRYLIRNHPHDSICGCSIDQVHRDMLYRFDQCDRIAQGVIRRALAQTGRAADTDEALRHITVHNPLPFDRKGIYELALHFPAPWPKTYIDGLATSERINKFAIIGPDGGRVPFQLSAIERGVIQKRLRDNGRETAATGDVYHIAAELSLPAAGCAGFHIEPIDEAVRNAGSLMTGPMSAANEHLDFTLHPDGTGSLACTHASRAYDSLFLYEDCGDAGDGWTRGQLVNDIVYRGAGSRVATAIDEDGPLRTVFRVEREFLLPAQMDRRTGWRSEDRAVLRVTDRIYVERGAKTLRVRTQVQNVCRDHRFRVMFPTYARQLQSFAETPFAVVKRDIETPPEARTWHERINPEKAFSTFFGISDGGGGLAVLAPAGLHEYEVTQTQDRSLVLTLFRSTWATVNTNGEPDGELLCDLDFEYALYPFKGTFDPALAARLVAEAQTGIRVHTSPERVETKSFVRLLNNAAVPTALKPAADGKGGIIRLWNPSTEPVDEVIHVARPLISAASCNLNEETREAIPLTREGEIAVTVPARGLLTVRFLWR